MNPLKKSPSKSSSISAPKRNNQSTWMKSSTSIPATSPKRSKLSTEPMLNPSKTQTPTSHLWWALWRTLKEIPLCPTKTSPHMSMRKKSNKTSSPAPFPLKFLRKLPRTNLFKASSSRKSTSLTIIPTRNRPPKTWTKKSTSNSPPNWALRTSPPSPTPNSSKQSIHQLINRNSCLWRILTFKCRNKNLKRSNLKKG